MHRLDAYLEPMGMNRPAVLASGYLILGGGLDASYRLGSVPGVVAIALTGAALTAALCADFSRLSARGVGISFEAQRRRRDVSGADTVDNRAA